MDRELRYCTTDDGVRIAYWFDGAPDGLPMVLCDGALLGLDISEERWKPTLERFRMGAFDHRGFGASSRSLTRPISSEGLVSDLAAVIDALGFERVALDAMHDGCATAITYAASHPERVSCLVLTAPFVRASEFLRPAAVHGFTELVRGDWKIAARTLADIAMPQLLPADRDMYSQHYASMTSPEMMIAFIETFAAMDVREQLLGVTVPTLIFHERDYSFIPIRCGQDVAALLPHARFIEIQHRGDSGFKISDHWGTLFGFIQEHGSLNSTSGVAPSFQSRPRLSKREQEVLRLLAAGRSNRQIAEELVLSERTVVRHIANIYAKIDAHGRAEATSYALRHGIA